MTFFEFFLTCHCFILAGHQFFTTYLNSPKLHVMLDSSSVSPLTRAVTVSNKWSSYYPTVYNSNHLCS
jgi:hypothetical protein